LSVVVTIIYSAIATFVILMVVKALTGLRVSHEEEIAGLDSSQHREKAYNL
jgi:Amt family ammonium transporter